MGIQYKTVGFQSVGRARAWISLHFVRIQSWNVKGRRLRREDDDDGDDDGDGE